MTEVNKKQKRAKVRGKAPVLRDWGYIVVIVRRGCGVFEVLGRRNLKYAILVGDFDGILSKFSFKVIFS